MHDHPELPLDPDAPPLHLRPWAVALVFIGGCCGTLARYGFARWEPTRTGSWPWGTFIANVIGSLILGGLLEGLARRGPDVGQRQRLRLLIGTGFCGGLTTYSTFAVETDLLVRNHCLGLAVGYLLVSLVAGVIAVVGGIALMGRRA